MNNEAWVLWLFDANHINRNTSKGLPVLYYQHTMHSKNYYVHGLHSVVLLQSGATLTNMDKQSHAQQSKW